MSTESNLEERYIVFKLGDLHRYCSNFDISSIERVWQIIAKGRALEDKRPFRAVVIEDDLPEYEQIWDAIEARVTGAQPAPSVPDGWLQHAARMAALARKLREPDWHFESIREMQRELCALEEAALAAAPEAKP